MGKTTRPTWETKGGGAAPVEGEVAGLGAGGDLGGPCARGCQQLLLGDDAVDEAQLGGLLVVDGRARQHHLRRRLQAHQPRQPLRAAESRQDSQLQLWQPQLCACAIRDPIRYWCLIKEDTAT